MEILEKKNEELNEIFKDETESSKKYYLNEYLYFKINNNFYRIDKGNIKTYFCAAAWSYYDNSEEREKAAYKYLNDIEHEEKFFTQKQLEELDAYKEMERLNNIKQYETIYKVKYPNSNFIILKVYDDPEKISGYINHGWGKDDYEKNIELANQGKILFEKVTTEELTEYKQALNIAIEKFLKRVKTYWKKYQGTKLHTWTYYED